MIQSARSWMWLAAAGGLFGAGCGITSSGEPPPAGTSAGGNASDGGSAGCVALDASAAITPHQPQAHRPTGDLCVVSDTPACYSIAADAGVVACQVDADCKQVTATLPNGSMCDDGAPQARCEGGACRFDACLTDADCAPGSACSCQGKTRGYAGSSTGNACIPAGCRTDADCGASQRCSPTVGAETGPFYGVQGYYCHTPEDTCIDDADCCTPYAYCAYFPETGHWACGDSHQAG